MSRKQKVLVKGTIINPREKSNYSTINFLSKNMIVVFVIIFTIWSLFAYFFPIINPDPENRGQIGDMFGALNALFSGFAFAVLIYTLWLQRDQINIQQKELSRAQKDSDLQNLENKFFNLIDLQNKILEQIIVTDTNDKEQRGKEAFKVIFEEIEYLYKIFTEKPYARDDKKLAKLLTEKYVSRYWPQYFEQDESHEFKAQFAIESIINDRSLNSETYKLKLIYYAVFHRYHSEIGHYFRHLYHILKFLNTRESQDIKRGKKENKAYRKYKSYADILQAQISTSEMQVLFFNGLCFINMRRYIYHYKFLENLAKDFLIKEEHVIQYGGEKIDNVIYDKMEFKSLEDLIK